MGSGHKPPNEEATLSQFELPTRGVVFWPVGNGDSVTIVVDAETVIQWDINHRAIAEEDEDNRVPVVDRLADVLPLASDGSTPRLAVLAITHHDADHCSGFDRLCDEFQVDEMWLTLRSFVEAKNEDELTEIGALVYEEAKRRRKAEIAARASGAGRAAPGDRLRIIGRHELLDDEDWKGFPEDLVTRAGEFVPEINGEVRSDVIEVFVHTPFHEDTGEGSRNSSCLGARVTLKDGDCQQRFLLLGDLEHKQVEAFVEKSEARNNSNQLPWDYLLAPHHGSRNAIMCQDNGEWVKAAAFEYLRKYVAEEATIIVSARAVDDKSDDDTDPPHEDALACYREIVGVDRLLLTADWANGTDSDPVTIDVTRDSCGACRESKAAWKARVRTVAALSGAAIRPGDSRGASGDQEFA
jgi:beta-lactamase superfamily II metal-dependent hydrolase